MKQHQCLDCKYNKPETAPFGGRVGLPMEFDKCEVFSLHPVNTGKNPRYDFDTKYSLGLNKNQNCPLFEKNDDIHLWKFIVNLLTK